MTAKLNGTHSKPNMQEFGWWWQKEKLDDIETDIHEAILGFKIRFRREPLHAIIYGKENEKPIMISNIQVWQDPQVPENVVVLQ